MGCQGGFQSVKLCIDLLRFYFTAIRLIFLLLPPDFLAIPGPRVWESWNLVGISAPKKKKFSPPPPNSSQAPSRPLPPLLLGFSVKKPTPTLLAPRTPPSPSSRKKIKNIQNVHQGKHPKGTIPKSTGRELKLQEKSCQILVKF